MPTPRVRFEDGLTTQCSREAGSSVQCNHPKGVRHPLGHDDERNILLLVACEVGPNDWSKLQAFLRSRWTPAEDSRGHQAHVRMLSQILVYRVTPRRLDPGDKPKERRSHRWAHRHPFTSPQNNVNELTGLAREVFQFRCLYRLMNREENRRTVGGSLPATDLPCVWR